MSRTILPHDASRRPFAGTAPEPGPSHRGWLMSLGIIFLVLGVIGLALAFLVTLATTVAFGILLLAGGGAQTVHAFSVPEWRERSGYLAVGALYLLAGILILFNPVAASAALTFFLAVALLVLGGIRIAYAVRNREHRKWLWPLVSGNLSILLGIMILLQWPLAGLWGIGLLLSLELMSHGWSAVALPLFDRRQRRVQQR